MYDIHDLILFELSLTDKQITKNMRNCLMHMRYHQHKVNILIISGKKANANNVCQLKHAVAITQYCYVHHTFKPSSIQPD